MSDFQNVITRILDKRQDAPSHRAVLVGISGIDGSGKGFSTGRIADQMHEHGIRTAVINVDGWLNLPRHRFNPANPAEHFYEHGIRFDAMFERLILPLRKHRAVRVTVDIAEETAATFRKHTYDLGNVDVILLEGIFLLKREYRGHLDLSIWIDCTFETALERAIARGQEGLPPEETVRAFHTIYFPAQRIHFQRDEPRAAATLILPNDPRLVGERQQGKKDGPSTP